MKKSKITGITQKAKNSVDKSESTINRFARFMGVMTKSVTKDSPNQQTLKKAGLFAKNFGGGRSSKVNKMLLGGALMLPLVLGQMISKERSTEELLQNQYGGNEKAMQSDLKEEQKIRDEGLEKVKTTADENKDISLDRKKDLKAVSQKDPEEIPKSEVDSDATTLERMNDRLSSVDGGIDKKNSDQFVELMDRFVFLAKVGAFGVVDKGPTLSERIDQTKANIRKFTGGKIDDGVFSLGFGINIPYVLSEKGRQKLGLGPKDNSKDQKSQIREITESVDAQIAKNEKAYTDAGALAADEEATKKYLRTKTELEKLKKRLQDEPLTVLNEMMSDANPSSVSSQSTMLSLGGGGGTGEQNLAAFLSTMEASGNQNQADAFQVMLNRAADAQAGGSFRAYGTSLGDQITGREQFSPLSSAIYGVSADSAAAAKYGPISSALGNNPQERKKRLLEIASQPDGLNALQKLFGGGSSSDALKVLKDFQTGGSLSQTSVSDIGSMVSFRGYRSGSGDFNRGKGGNFFFGSGSKTGSLKQVSPGTDPMGDQSSLTPNKPNQIAQFVPTGYMPYDDPSKSSSQIIALTPTPVNTSQQPIVTGSGDSGSPQIIPVADHGSLFTQIQLNSLALT